MMKIFLALILVLVFSSCKDNGTENNESEKVNLTAKWNVEENINDEYKVKLINVTDDSRCPDDVTCVWAGQASITVALIHDTLPQEMYSFIYTPGQSVIIFEKETFVLKLIDLKPHTNSNKAISQDEYYLELNYLEKE